MSVLRNRLLMEEKSFDRQLLAIERDKLLPKLNDNQHQIFNLIVNACLNNEQQLVFVYGHGGTGKTFMWKTILYTLRCEQKIVLVVASSGIASLLLPAGRTAHSRFKISLDLTDTSVCAIKKNTQLTDLLKETCFIVWEESPMNDRWTAMFAQWLLDVRNGEIGIPDDSDPDNTSWVDTPDEYCIPNDDNGIIILINFIYDDDTLHHPFAQKLQEKAIICPKNDTTDVINSKYLSLLMAITTYPDTVAASKGKMIAIEPKVLDIASLKPTDSNKIIEVIVYCKWVSNAYRITSFSCEQTVPWERTLDNPTSLTFRRFISLQEILNADFPEHYFNFAAYNELPAKTILDTFKQLVESTLSEALQQIDPTEG
ncbi:DNA helicase [Tanacetum coccineum]